MILHRTSTRLACLLAACLLAGLAGSAAAGAGGTVLSYTAPVARSVAVAGSFNHWDPSGHPLSGPDRNGIWTITLSLDPGRYEYQFVVNGTEWVPDPAAPSVPDGMGGRNSVITVPGEERQETQ